MNITHKISAWGDRHHPKIIDIVLMIFGAFLVFKGVVFFNDSGYLRDLILAKEAVNQPPGLITAIIMETGICRPPYGRSLQKALAAGIYSR